jgi:hypothetical protein
MREALQQLTEETAKAVAAPLWPLADVELVDCLQAVHRWEQTIVALKARLTREADVRGLPREQGHRTLAAWLRSRLRLDPAQARELADRAVTLHRMPAVEQALAEGAVDARQAAVIAAAVSALSGIVDEAVGGLVADDAVTQRALDVGLGGDAGGVGSGGSPGGDAGSAGGSVGSLGQSFGGVGESVGGPLGSVGSSLGSVDSAGGSVTSAGGPEAGAGPDRDRIVREAESVLIGMAGRFPAYLLRRLGDRILAHVAPEIADRADEAALRRQEARAHANRNFTMAMPIDGMVRVSGLLDVEGAAIVAAALEPLCTPIAGDDRTAAQRRADALIDVCGLALRTTGLPSRGGEPPQMTVTVPFDPVKATLKTAVLDNGERLSAATARRIACNARILPLVLGSASQVLDAGRTRRLATGSLRRALVARDRGCAFPDCDRPPRWCDAHHLTAWARGGPTNLDNLVLLCRHHHRLIHDPDHYWQVRLAADGLPEFLPPPEEDPSQVPRRNEYHVRT